MMKIYNDIYKILIENNDSFTVMNNIIKKCDKNIMLIKKELLEDKNFKNCYIKEDTSRMVFPIVISNKTECLVNIDLNEGQIDFCFNSFYDIKNKYYLNNKQIKNINDDTKITQTSLWISKDSDYQISIFEGKFINSFFNFNDYGIVTDFFNLDGKEIIHQDFFSFIYMNNSDNEDFKEIALLNFDIKIIKANQDINNIVYESNLFFKNAIKETVNYKPNKNIKNKI